MTSDQNFQITSTFFIKKSQISQKSHFLHIKLQLFWKPDVLVQFGLRHRFQYPKIYKKHFVWFKIIFGCVIYRVRFQAIEAFTGSYWTISSQMIAISVRGILRGFKLIMRPRVISRAPFSCYIDVVWA